MPQLQPGWQLSVVTGLLLLAIALVCRVLSGRVAATIGAFARQFTIVMLLLALWQRVGGYVHTRVAGAVERGHEIYRLQREWHLPDEVAVQHLVLPHPMIVRGLNIYYEFAHLNGMTIFMVWLWWRHRDAFPRVRDTVVLSTLACLLVQIVPVAPPRLLTDLGFVDTALLYGQSVYGEFGTGMANQVAAMPSVHVGWAVIVGYYVWRASPSRWRFIGPAHLVTTVFVVVATANHWWLDGLVAAGFVVLAVPVGALLRVLVGAVVRQVSTMRSGRRPVTGPAVDPALQPAVESAVEPAVRSVAVVPEPVIETAVVAGE